MSGSTSLFRQGGDTASPHHATTQVGRDVLAAGGNALEAMVAMAASIACVYPHMTHIGGDGFWLVREPQGQVAALMGAGPAGALASVDFYRERGHSTIPPRGPLAALTAPGAVGAWILALEMARSRGGRLPLSALLAPAIDQARSGYAATRSQAALTQDKMAELASAPGFVDTFTQGGAAPAVGARLVQPALAATLERLAAAGLDDFYRGDVGREIAADLEDLGSPVTRGDLERYRAWTAAPLSTRIASGELYNTPAPTQGLASLLILALFDRLSVAEAESFPFVHGLVEATKRAFCIRDRYVADPRFCARPLDSFLSEDALAHELSQIDPRRAAPWPAAASAGDTVWMGAADRSGLVVSYIQSIFWEFGSGCVLPKTGVLMQNRGASFSLERDAVNPLAPGRLPFHTLNPALAVLNDGRVMSYGTMGGDGQPQTQAMLFARTIMYGQSLRQALDAPRWLLGRTWGSHHTNLRMEARFSPDLVESLIGAGHDVDVLNEPYSDTMGHAGAVILHADGSVEADHDPRADGSRGSTI